MKAQGRAMVRYPAFARSIANRKFDCRTKQKLYRPDEGNSGGAGTAQGSGLRDRRIAVEAAEEAE
jgi:hypothetical protein